MLLNYEISKFKPEDWEELKHDLMKIEESCFHTNLRETEESKREIMTSEGTIAFLAKINGRVVGECYGVELKYIDLPGIIQLKKALYVMSIGVLPKYQRMGIGTALLSNLIEEAKRRGYKHIVSHAREGVSLKLHKKFGAKVKGRYDNWFDTGDTYYLCVIDL